MDTGAARLGQWNIFERGYALKTERGESVFTLFAAKLDEGIDDVLLVAHVSIPFVEALTLSAQDNMLAEVFCLQRELKRDRGVGSASSAHVASSDIVASAGGQSSGSKRASGGSSTNVPDPADGQNVDANISEPIVVDDEVVSATLDGTATPNGPSK